ELILIQLAQSHARLQHHVPDARLLIAAKDLHQCRLAAAVRANQSVAIAVGEFDSHLFEQRLGAELNANVGSRKHADTTTHPLARESRRVNLRLRLVTVPTADAEVSLSGPILS